MDYIVLLKQNAEDFSSVKLVGQDVNSRVRIWFGKKLQYVESYFEYILLSRMMSNSHPAWFVVFY